MYKAISRFLAAVGLTAMLVLSPSPLFGSSISPAYADSGVCGIPGSDGPAGTLSGIVNTYYPGTSSAGIGATTISVGAPSGSSSPIAAGDLLLVIQMQDASINVTNTDAYGDGVGGDPGSGSTSLNNVGRYEYVIATGPVSAGSVPINGAGPGNGLVYAYTNADASSTQGQRRFQVVRVPQYSTATLSSALSGLLWDGTVGGVLALDIAGELTLGGTVDISGYGFRGGGGRQRDGSVGLADTDYRTLTSLNPNGSKGEGIAGTPQLVYEASSNIVVDTGIEGYPNGSMARGAPGNAGGGGTDGNTLLNNQNTGGGGGGNAGTGGLGGNAWFSQDPTGGFGGVSFPSAPALLVPGGGGGAGTNNNTVEPSVSSGGTGGGIFLLRAASVTGNGSINADGLPGLSSLNDGGGGGGAGGSVLVLAQSGGLGGLTISAVGGDGGDSWPTQEPGGFPGNRHGPGGGGGGGAIWLSAAPASIDVAGGLNGITTTALDPYGATPGSPGTSQTDVSPSDLPTGIAGAPCLPDLTTIKTTSTPIVSNSPTGTSATYTITVSNAAGLGTALALDISDSLPAGFSYASTSSVVLSGGASRPSTANPSPGDTTPAWGSFDVPGGGSVSITFDVDIAASVPDGTYQNPANATYLDPQRTTASATTSTSYDPASSTAEDVTIGGPNIVDPKVDSLVIDADGNGTASPGDTIEYVITISNTGSVAATGVTFDDTPDVNTSLIIGSVTTGQGTVTSGNGAGDTSVTVDVGSLAVDATVTITFRVLINSPIPASVSQVENQGVVSGTNFSNSATDDPDTAPQDDPTATPITIPLGSASDLPETGFAPGIFTTLEKSPQNDFYTSLGDLKLNIPKLAVTTTIVGVGNDWDVTWLGTQVGYLSGTAYPTWRGNSVLTGHAILADGTPGPFNSLDKLEWDDEIAIELSNSRYIYQVRSAGKVTPDDQSALVHEESDWITLITCYGWDPIREIYQYRWVVRGILMQVEPIVPD